MRNPVIMEDVAFIATQNLDWGILRGKTVLISGAAGFLASYLVETLLYLNEAQRLGVKVVGLVRNLKKARERFESYDHLDALRLIPQDVCKNLVYPGNVHYVIHAASQASPKLFRVDPVGTILPNTVGTKNLLDLCVEKKVSGFMFFSTTGVYGHVSPSSYPIPENCFGSIDPTDLASCYIESKRMGENMCVAWMHQHGVPIKIVRPSITYGPGISLDDGRSFADFISNILSRKDIILYSEGMVLRNYCYIADAVVGFFKVLLEGATGEAYNVASEDEISVFNLATTLVKDIFPELHLKVLRGKDTSKDYLRMDFPRTATDVSKLKSLGWQSHFSLKDGFRRTVASYPLMEQR